MALQYTNPSLMPNGQGMLNRPPTVPLRTPPPYSPPSPIAASPLATLGEAALSLLAPVAAGIAAFFFNPSPAGDVNESQAVQNLNTGVKQVSTAPTYVPPFTGGQSTGVVYNIDFDRWIDGSFNATCHSTKTGAITSYKYIRSGSGIGYRRFAGDSCVIEAIANGVTSGELDLDNFFNNGYGGDNGRAMPEIRNLRITRQDNLPDTGGDLPNPNPLPTQPIPSGYTGGNGRDPNEKKVLPPNLSSTLGWGNTKPIPSSVVRPALGLGPEIAPKNLLPPAIPNRSPLISPAKTPIQDPPNKTPIQKPTDPLEKEKTPPFDPTKPYTPNSSDITGQLAGIGAILATIKANSTDIKNNTTPENQQFNAKTGSCQAMKSPSCTKDFEDRIKNPIMGNVDAAKAALTANQLAQDAGFLAIADNFTKVKNFLNNSIVDRALGAANFAMNVHNALMLSNALGRTLAGVVDTAMNLTPFQFADANTGAKTTASRAFSSNVSAIIINLIGQEQYVELTNDWKVANRIYQSSTSLLNKTERLLGAQSKVAQKGNIDVANIGNALRANGIVNPNSYPPMAATKEANTPPDLLADVNSPLSSFAGQVRNLNTITKSVNSTLRNVSGIQKEFGKLADLTNKESKVRKSLRSQVANQAKVKAKFTFLQIKQIKQTGKR